MPRWSEVPRFLRFIAIGGVNTLFGYGAYALFVWLGLHYAAAALFGTVAGVAFNFFTTGRLVFDRVPDLRSSVRFVAVYAAVYAANVTALALLAAIGVGPYAAGLLVLLPMAVLTFVLMRRFVFGVEYAAD